MERYLDELNNDLLHLDRLYNEFARRHGESYLSLSTLEVLGDHPEGVTQKQVASQVFVSKQTVNSMMQAFVKRGLVEQRASETDGRSKIHVLTEKGRAYVDAVEGELHAMDLAVAKRMGIDELRAVHEAIRFYTDEVERMMGEGRDGARV